MRVGRKRKSNPLGLPDRVYFNHGAFYYAHPGGRWENLGTDLAEAKRRGTHYADPKSEYGTMAWFLNDFITECKERVEVRKRDPKAKNGLAERTYKDYKGNVIPLKKYFGKMTPAQVMAPDVNDYLDMGLKGDRGVRANRERACLSACFSWMIGKGLGGVKTNPCLRESGVTRNPEEARDVYVEDEAYKAVYSIAVRQVCGAMALIYRTLQRPSDVLSWSAKNVVTKRVGERQIKVLQFKQGKTGAPLEIEIDVELEDILVNLDDGRKVKAMTLIHNGSAQPYTESGIASMHRRYVTKANAGRDGAQTWGLMDLRGKGATDMYQAGVALEKIQQLMGHESVTTTEIYVKRRLRAVAQPNQVKMA